MSANNTWFKPSDDLYIYLIQGVVNTQDERLLGDDFIGNWIEEQSSFLFFQKPAKRLVCDLLEKRTDLQWLDEFLFTYEQWQGGVLKPITVENIVISSPWESLETFNEKQRIFLDPGVVFGNGLHPTTRDCLRAIQAAFDVKRFDHVLDLGTGTGVLAIASAMLGAKRVSAVDLNPLCVKTTDRNIQLNGLGRIIGVTHGTAEMSMKEPADLIIANIHHEVIAKLLNNINTNDVQQWIISGLLRSQARDVRTQIEQNRFELIQEWDHEMTWYTLWFETSSVHPTLL